MNKKKLNIKGVIVDYGNVKTWNGKLWSERELQEYYEKSVRDNQEARHKEHKAEQAEKKRQERERLAYQASLNVSTLPPGMFEGEEQLSKGQFLFGAVIFISLCLLAVLALSYMARGG